MADNNFRTTRSRDPVAPGSADSSARGPIDDPLAELARLIGQNEPMDNFGRDPRRAPAHFAGDTAPAEDWAADDERYAAPDELAEEPYDPLRLSDPYPSYPPALASREDDYEPPVARPRLNSPRDGGRGYAAGRTSYRDEPQPFTETPDNTLPAFLPRARDDRYEYDDREQDGSGDQSYAMADYDDEAPAGPRRRTGLVVVATVLGMAVLGTAGAFAYRAMFGGSMLPSLPPIIRADNGPNKILPNAVPSNNSTSDQADASGSAEKLVPRQEQPVDVPPPLNAAPRVVSTIPIFPAPTPGPPGGQVSAAPPAAMPAPVAPAPLPPPAASAAPIPPLVTAPAPASPEPKKIHTVAIRPDQASGPDATAVPATIPAPQPATHSPPPRPVAVAPAPKPNPAAAPQLGANAPLSIVPSQGEVATPAAARTHTALAHQPTPAPAAETEPAPSAGGGYAVQVTSQRSEAEAQTAFRALRAKYPDQLGGHEPMVRRADLGDKGVYYRALVGPFASMEQAAGICSSLKAAGGNCIVQKN
jgi:hypothetical protein